MRPMVEGPADWRGPEMAKSRDWIHDFTAMEIAEIERAFIAAREHGKTLATLTREDFPLPTVSQLFRLAQERLEGAGLQLFRGFPIAGHSKDELRFIYWGLGLHLGTAVSQSRDGDLLGDVRDIGVDIKGPKGRGYRSKQRLSFHTDTCDVTGLFCLRVAMSGGLSKIASSVAAHNEMLRQRPDLLEVLYAPFHWSWNGQEPEGAPPYYAQPIFSMEEGYFSCRYIRGQIRNAQLFPEVPRWTAAQQEALDLLDAIAERDDFHITMMFEPGDLQLLNNHICFHARTAFENHADPDRHRHLLRMWLSVPNSRPLSPMMGTIYRDRRPGAVRGGFPSRTGRHIFETVVTTD